MPIWYMKPCQNLSRLTLNGGKIVENDSNGIVLLGSVTVSHDRSAFAVAPFSHGLKSNTAGGCFDNTSFVQ